MRQHIALGLFIHDGNVVVGDIDWFNPVARRINDYRGASTTPAARDQHRHHAYG